jgi:hypothetical protein
MPVCIKMIAGTTSDISAVVRNRTAVKDHQHSLKASEPIALPAPVTCFYRSMTGQTPGMPATKQANIG